MPFQSTLMEPHRSKSITYQVELQASLSATTEPKTTDSETAIRSEEVTLSSNNNYSQLKRLLPQMHPTFSEDPRKRPSSQSQLLSSYSNNRSRVSLQVLVQDLSPQ